MSILDTLPQPLRIAIAPNTALDKQMATATEVRMDGDMGVYLTPEPQEQH